MLKSVSRMSALFKALWTFCVLLFITTPYYVKIERSGAAFASKYLIIVDRLMGVGLLLLLFVSIYFIYLKSKSKSFYIDKNRVTIKLFLKADCGFALSDIIKIEWGSSKKRAFANLRFGVASRGDFICVSLIDGSKFYFDVTEYKNFDELRAWLLTYGRKAGIIKTESINNRGRG